MTSIQPYASSTFAGLVFEVQTVTGFGTNPINSVSGSDTDTPAVSGRRIAKRLDALRSRVFPVFMQSMVRTQLTVVQRVKGTVADDPLADNMIQALTAVHAVIAGPSAENIASGLLQVGDLEAIVAANELATPLTTKDAVRLDGVDYDIVGIQGYPQHPAPVAYRYMLKKAA